MARLSFINDEQFQSYLTKNANKLFSASLYSIFKPFSTKPNATGLIPNYQSSAVTGVIGSFLLNPFGANTVHQGITFGDTTPTDLNDLEQLSRNASNVRSVGFKTPMTHVGWGYDIFGYPAPNAESIWSVSGQFNKFDKWPSTNFLSSPASNIGSNVPENLFLAGPMDLRWDNIRQVWTSQLPVYPAVISKVDIANDGNSSEPQYPSGILYSARIFDGVSSGIVVTGLRPANRSPLDETYKVYPARVNDACFLISTPYEGDITKPRLSIWINEIPYAEACSTSTSSPLSRSNSSTTGTSSLSLADFADDPLDINYGGTSYNTYNPGEILVGTNAFTLGKYSLLAGSGIEISANYSVPTGIVRISLASGVAFADSGFNTNITRLGGLTTPLSLAQGGTGASGKIFVDVSGNQSVSGIKNFIDQVGIGFGSVASPGLTFNSVAAGLTYNSLSGVIIANGGYNVFNAIPTQVRSSVGLYIKETVQSTGRASLLIQDSYYKNFIECISSTSTKAYITFDGVYTGYGISVTGVASGIPILIGGDATHTQPYLQISRATGIKVFSIDSTGISFFVNNRSANLIPTHTGVINIYLPANSGTLALEGINSGPSKYTTTLSSGNSLYNVNHNLNTRYAITSVFEAVSPYEVVYPTIQMSGLNNLTVDFGINTTINYEVTVIG